MINKNKTKFGSSLKLYGTLSSILTIKCAEVEPCRNFEPPTEVLEIAKKSTMTYNLAHCN